MLSSCTERPLERFKEACKTCALHSLLRCGSDGAMPCRLAHALPRLVRPSHVSVKILSAPWACHCQCRLVLICPCELLMLLQSNCPMLWILPEKEGRRWPR